MATPATMISEIVLEPRRHVRALQEQPRAGEQNHEHGRRVEDVLDRRPKPRSSPSRSCVRTIRILVGSLASRPSGVRFPIASATSQAPKASPKRNCGSLAQAIQARVRQTMRNAPSSTTTANHQPIAADAVDDHRPPAGALHGKDQERDPDYGDNDVQEREARTGHSPQMLTRIIPPTPSCFGETGSYREILMAERLVGTNYVTPDIVAKVTGPARYAEDFRADGMLFCKLMLSERPHARVRAHRYQPRDALDRRPRDPHARRRAAAWRHHRALPDQGAAVCRRADPCRGRDERGDRGGSDRVDSPRSRAAAARHRSDREPAPGRAQCPHRRQRLGRRPRASRRARRSRN